MICNTMSHWVPIKHISEKYQIDENYICNLIVRKVVTSSQIGRKVKLIDEDSFISYLDLHKEIEDKKEIIAQLRDTDRMLEVELRACNETRYLFVAQYGRTAGFDCFKIFSYTSDYIEDIQEYC